MIEPVCSCLKKVGSGSSLIIIIIIIIIIPLFQEDNILGSNVSLTDDPQTQTYMYRCVPKCLWVAIFTIIIYIPQVDINVCYRLMPI